MTTKVESGLVDTSILSGGLLAVYSLTGSGTFTKQNSLANKIRLRLQGGGASGGGAVVTSSGQFSVGSPGGPGAYVEAWLDEDDFSGAAYSVGAAGAAGAAGANGNNGGDTTFGDVVAKGGTAGTAGTALSTVPGILGGNPNANATATGGYLNMPGRHASPDIQTSTATVKNLGAAKPVLGDSARAAVMSSGADGLPAPSGYGGAGTGGLNAASQATARAGGAGGAGTIIVEEYWTSESSLGE